MADFFGMWVIAVTLTNGAALEMRLPADVVKFHECAAKAVAFVAMREDATDILSINCYRSI